jgi:hypothetical protein
MQPKETRKMQLPNMARCMQAMSASAIVILASLFAWALIDPSLAEPIAQERNWTTPVPYSFLGPLLATTFLFTLPAFLAFWHVTQLFGLFAKGDSLSPDIIARIGRLARTLFTLALLNILWGPSMDILHMLVMSPENGSIAVGLSEHQIIYVLAGGLLLAIARGLEAGYQATLENRAFV